MERTECLSKPKSSDSSSFHSHALEECYSGPFLILSKWNTAIKIKQNKQTKSLHNMNGLLNELSSTHETYLIKTVPPNFKQQLSYHALKDVYLRKVTAKCYKWRVEQERIIILLEIKAWGRDHSTEAVIKYLNIPK